MPELSAATRLIALLGDPVSHSLSPVFQNAALAAAGLDGVYLALRCTEPDVPGLIRGITRSGGAGNITIPHKAVAASVLDQRTAAVEATGVCNTFWFENGDIWGDNTDVAGVSTAVNSLLGRSPRGARVLLLGAGGAARAAVCALLDDGVEHVTVLNRSVDRATDLRASFAHAAPISVAPALHALNGETFDLVINSTSLGLRQSDALPLSVDSGIRFGAALDLVYSPNATPWVHALRAEGIPATDGIEMLIGQGAAAFSRWWGIDAPLDVMRAAMARD